MSSLFRNLNNFARKRENAIKEALINTLSENAREIEFEVKQNGLECLELCEQTNSLCTTLEAIFLHGLKDSFLWQTINVLAGDVERRPEPSFWSPIMVFLHKQVIEQINALSQITSEIGQCRAWIRQSLNESLFSSYMNTMRKNRSALSPYYKQFALVKDADGLETAAKIMESLEAYVQFNLPVNSSLLNYWPDYALQLSGVWTPTLKSCPISSGVDVASSLSADTAAIATPQPVRTNELFSESISNSPFSRCANFGVPDLNQRENLELFLQKVDEMDIINEEDNKTPNNAASDSKDEANEQPTTSKRKRKQSRDRTVVDIEDETINTMKIGNSLTNLMQTSWSSDLSASGDTDASSSHSRNLNRSVSNISSSSSTLRSPLTDRCSYNALLRKHERSRDLDWTEVWEKFLMQNNVLPPQETDVEAKDDEDEELSDLDSTGNSSTSKFEMTSGTALEKFDIAELQMMVEQLCRLPRESGLAAQGFLCKSCQHPLGIGYSNFQVCAFSGNYFCDACFDLEPVFIPARIIYNWDFRKYTVSKRAALFLAEFRFQPFIDLKLLNPAIYEASDAMAELQSLRIRLNFIRAYLYTCGTSNIEELQRQFFGKEYLYEHIHQYSIDDLALIHRGTLYQQLQKAYKTGEAHILKCHLCSVKGFICEICNSARVLYPFHIDTTFRCETCGAVFHAQCLNEQQPCPKCERKRKREMQPLLEAVQGIELEHEAAVV